jgi:hypothetical protein
VKLKSHYRHFATGGSVDGLDVAPDLRVNVTEDNSAATALHDLERAFEAGDTQAQAEATARISRANTLAAEQRVAAAARQPQHNLTPRQQAFLDSNPEMLDQPERLGKAILDAHMANHEIDSDAFHNHVAHAFRIQHLETAAHNKAALEHPPGSAEHHQVASDHLDKFISDVNDPEPEFFKPKPKPESRPVGMQHLGSALARRDNLGGTIASRNGGDYSGTNPSRVTLSVAEKEMARALGQTELSYAQGKIELARRKSEGWYDK